MKSRRWVPILFGVAVFVVFAGIGGALFTYSWVRDHLDVQAATDSSATAAFDEIRQRYVGKPPLVEVSGNDTRSRVPPKDAPRASLSALHVLAWNPDDEHLARIDIPFWLIRLKESPIRFANYASGAVDFDVPITAADIERYGPGIVVDLHRPGRERALVWVD
jgi:hypothetical protein